MKDNWVRGNPLVAYASQLHSSDRQLIDNPPHDHHDHHRYHHRHNLNYHRHNLIHDAVTILVFDCCILDN